MKRFVLMLLLLCLLLLCAWPSNAAADVAMLDDFAVAAAGDGHSLALRHDGDLWAFGDNRYGQLGSGAAELAQAEPALVLQDVAAIAAGATHSLAVKNDGSLWAWGDNYYGQLGNGGGGDYTREDDDEAYYQSVPLKIMDDVQAVAAGYGFSLILKTDGSLWACGLNEQGQIGNGGTGDAEEPIYLKPVQTIAQKILDDVQSISAGTTHALAVKTDGSLWAWGDNAAGQLGNNGEANNEHERYGPYQDKPLMVFESGVRLAAADTQHSLAIMGDDSLWGWGDNSVRQLRDSEQRQYLKPQRLMADSLFCAASRHASFIIDADDSLWGWGRNDEQKIHFDFVADRQLNTPHQILDDVVHISSGALHTLAVKSDGTLWAWGDGSYGQLGPGGRRVVVDYAALRQQEAAQAGSGAEVVTPPTPDNSTATQAPADDTPTPPEQPEKTGRAWPWVVGGVAVGACGCGGLLLWKKKFGAKAS